MLPTIIILINPEPTGRFGPKYRYMQLSADTVSHHIHRTNAFVELGKVHAITIRASKKI
jgi:hypothetical protein